MASYKPWFIIAMACSSCGGKAAASAPTPIESATAFPAGGGGLTSIVPAPPSDPVTPSAPALPPDSMQPNNPTLTPAVRPPSTPNAASTLEDPNSTHAILQRSSTVVEGVAESVALAYDEGGGPRTIWTFRVEDVYAGESPGSLIQLSMFGGSTPDGDFVGSSLTTSLLIGARYVLFLRNDEWFNSPLSATALRVEVAFGREVLVRSEGHSLTELTPAGMGFGFEPVFLNVSAPVVDPTVERIQSQLLHDASPLSTAGSLDRINFRRLLAQAISSETVTPTGHFTEKPAIRQDNWRVTPTAPSER